MSAPITTVVDFGSLPACATACGVLYDVNGACVPPAAATADAATYDSCFCKDARLQPFVSTSAGVCGAAACTDDPAGLGSIQAWFTNFCSDKTSTGVTSAAAQSSTSSSGSSVSTSNNGDWLSNHWKWVIMIIIVVVGIAGIWVGACIWRRKYLKKKDRMYELGKGLPSSVAVNAQGQLVGPGVQKGPDEPGMFMTGSGNVANNEKPRKERKRWNVTQRT